MRNRPRHSARRHAPGAPAPVRRRGSVLLASIVMVIVAALTVISWLGYLSAAHHAGIRDRARLQAFYAAEAGVEAVVDFFNNPTNFLGELPGNYTAWQDQPGNYPLTHAVAPEVYDLFAPYIVSYARDGAGNPMRDGSGNLVVTQSTYFRNLAAGNARAVSRTSKIPTATLDLSQQDRLVFKAANGTELSRVESIRLVHPIDIEAQEGSLPGNTRIITKVIAIGATPEGVRVAVESIITENPVFQVVAPGAIISRATVQYNGNFEAFWGEVWANADVILPNNWTNKVPRWSATATDFQPGNPATDPWFRFRTTGWMKSHAGQFANGSDRSGWTAAAPAAGTVAYTQPWSPSIVATTGRGRGTTSDNTPHYSNVYQNQPLNFPDYEYDEWKRFVQAYGFRYFFTNNSGTLFGIEENPASPQFGQLVGKSYAQWLGVSPTDDNYNAMERKIVFIDSIPTNAAGQIAPNDPVTGAPIINDEYFPRNPRTDPAARMATIRVSGGGLHTHGAFLVAANMEMTGQGNPPSWQQVPNVIKPNYQAPTGLRFDISHNGLLYSWGTIDFSGNRTFYGSVYAERGYLGSGTPSVYYDVRLGDGSWLNLNTSRVNRNLWNFRAVDSEGNPV